MKSKKQAAVAVLFAAALGVAAAPSFAQERGFYVGGSIGQTEAGNWCDSAPGFAVTSCDDEDTGFKGFVGYRFNRNFAVEGSYMDAGEFTGTVTAGGTSASVTADATAWGIAAVGFLPLSDRFDLFGKIGFVRGESEATVSVGGSTFTVGDDGTELHYGLGAIYNLTRNWGVRGEWENVDDADISMLSLGVQYRF